MQRIVKLGKTIRTNWKKSTLGAVALYYGGSWAKDKYEINILMEAACKEAATYGEALIPMDRNPTLVTVILNPVANKRKAKKDFEKYCEPLLHLAGLQLDVIQTTSEGNAKDIVETLRGTEAIIVAGGDGTLSETVTGLLRRNDEANKFPLGILPLGQTNSLGNTLFPGGKGVEKVKQLIEASMAIIKGNTEPKDVIKIEPISTDNETPSRPIYALSSIQWGAFRDVSAKKDKYWFFGPWREHAAFIFNGYKDTLTWNCSGEITYTPPCVGCNNCVTKKTVVKRNWFFMPSTQSAKENDYSKIINPECAVEHELCFKVSEFKLNTPNVAVSDDSEVPALKIVLGKNRYTYREFVSEGWRRLKGESVVQNDAISARTIKLMPNSLGSNEVIQIDNEDFDVKPVKIVLLPKIVKLFCKSQLN